VAGRRHRAGKGPITSCSSPPGRIEGFNRARYTRNGLPLWLLIVCDAVEDGDEGHGDRASHVFPTSPADQGRIADVPRQTGFAFQAGPFSEVWLFSSFTGQRHRPHPQG
jgi:hypothetical protein